MVAMRQRARRLIHSVCYEKILSCIFLQLCSSWLEIAPYCCPAIVSHQGAFGGAVDTSVCQWDWPYLGVAPSACDTPAALNTPFSLFRPFLIIYLAPFLPPTALAVISPHVYPPMHPFLHHHPSHIPASTPSCSILIHPSGQTLTRLFTHPSIHPSIPSLHLLQNAFCPYIPLLKPTFMHH